jgi:hypothetical protein
MMVFLAPTTKAKCPECFFAKLTPSSCRGRMLTILRPRVRTGSEKPGPDAAGLLTRAIAMKAWVFQDDKQVKKVGSESASFYVGFFDPTGRKRCRSCGPGASGMRAANKLREKIAAELLTGTFEDPGRKTWDEFRQEYEANPALDPLVRTCYRGHRFDPSPNDTAHRLD